MGRAKRPGLRTTQGSGRVSTFSSGPEDQITCIAALMGSSAA
jgi:hypothetical protein